MSVLPVASPPCIKLVICTYIIAILVTYFDKQMLIALNNVELAPCTELALEFDVQTRLHKIQEREFEVVEHQQEMLGQCVANSS